jgi:hypothetical protein
MGSGYLVTERLVLTAAHVVRTDSGVETEAVEVRPSGSKGPVQGRVVWSHQQEDIDAALIQITDSRWQPSGLRPLRWGRLTGQGGAVSCEAVGFPRVLRQLDGMRESEHLNGHINPGTRLVGRRYDVHVDSSTPAVSTDPGRPRPGRACREPACSPATYSSGS